MKKLTAVFLTLFMLIFTAACQETPEEVIVVKKDAERMIEAAQNGAENSALLSALKVPERFTGEWKGADGRIIVTADASITLPAVSAVPTATVIRSPFSQEDADKLMKVFLKGSTLYQEQEMTRQFAMELLERFQAMQRGEIPLQGDATAEKLPELIEYYAELARTAPDKNDSIPAEVTFRPDDFWGEVIQGFAEVDGKKVHTLINNNSELSDQAVFYQDGYGDVNCCNSVPVAEIESSAEAAITKEDAIRIGDDLMLELGLSNTVCAQITAVAFKKLVHGEDRGVFDGGYELEYVRTVNGFPVAHTPFDGTSSSENERFIGVWAYERITVCVSENGVVYFKWTNPYTEPLIQTEDTHLLSFSDVADIFAKMIIVKNSYLKAANAANGFDVILNIDITDVRLELMRIRGKNTVSEGLLVPVWDFWGTVGYHAADSAYSDVAPSRE